MFIKESSFENIKKKLQILYLLNISDIIFTLILLRTNMFQEANGAMVSIVENPLLSIILKGGLVGILIYYIIKRIKKATNKQLKISNYIINAAITAYSIINLMHMCYVLLYFYIRFII